MSGQSTLAEGMIRILAGTFVLCCKARMFAWSIGTDPLGDTRAIVKCDYTVLQALADEVAEQVIAIGGQIPNAYEKIVQISSVKKEERDDPMEMVRDLVSGHEQMIFDAQFLITLLGNDPDKEAKSLLLRSIDQHRICADKLSELLPPEGAVLN